MTNAPDRSTMILKAPTRQTEANLKMWNKRMGLSQNDLKENHERQSSFVTQSCGKKQKKREKQYTKPEGQDLPLRACALFFSEAYAAVGTTYAAVGTNRCVPNRPVCIL